MDVAPYPKPSCVVDGCELLAKCKGLCRRHYAWSQRHDGATPPPTSTERRPQPSVCTVDGCELSTHCRDWCRNHYTRWLKYGTPTPPPKHRPCQEDACDERAYAKGWCKSHYWRWYHTGSPDPRVPKDLITPGGYRSSLAKGHPLANAKGYAYEHRLVLYERIGPGRHLCRWCSTPITWDVRDIHDPTCLTVDHLDGQRLHNVPGNLVPSCLPCNSARKTKAGEQQMYAATSQNG